MRRMSRWRYLVLPAACVAGNALACLCSPEDLEGSPLEKATLVFVGSPVKIEEVRPLPPARNAWGQVRATLAALFGAPSEEEIRAYGRFLDNVRVTFEVSEYVKGKGPQRVQVMTGHGDSDCGLRVSVAERYTTYAHQMEGALRTSYCFGSEAYVPPRRRQMCDGGAR